MSRKIIVTQYASIDGVIEDPVGMENSGLGDWTGPFTRGPAGDRFKLEELMAADAMVYGRLTYDGFAAVWPGVDDPDGFAPRMNALPKYLASRTIEQPRWNNTTLISGDLLAAVASLKATPGGDILIYGSASIVHQLLPARLIDEVRLMIYPMLLGRGKKWYPDGFAARLEMIENTPFDDGIVLLRYRIGES